MWRGGEGKRGIGSANLLEVLGEGGRERNAYSIVSFLASTEWGVQLVYSFAILFFLPLLFLDTQSLFSPSFPSLLFKIRTH